MAQTVDEARLHAGRFQRAADSFAAAVHHHRIDLDRLQKNHVPRHARAHGLVRTVHETAAVLDYERCAGKSLNVRQRFEQCGGFGDEFLHVSLRAIWGR